MEDLLTPETIGLVTALITLLAAVLTLFGGSGRGRNRQR